MQVSSLCRQRNREAPSAGLCRQTNKRLHLLHHWKARESVRQYQTPLLKSVDGRGPHIMTASKMLSAQGRAAKQQGRCNNDFFGAEEVATNQARHHASERDSSGR